MRFVSDTPDPPMVQHAVPLDALGIDAVSRSPEPVISTRPFLFGEERK